jgi:molybdopterin converting factor small subunit
VRIVKVSIKINGLPEFKKIVGGKKEFEFVFNGTNLRDLVDNLVKEYGPSIEKTILDKHGAIDSIIKVVHNEENFLRGNRMKTMLHDGDTLIFMVGGCC